MWSAWSSFQTTLRHFLVKVKQNKKFGYELCITVHYDSYENCLCQVSLWCCMTCMRTVSVSCHCGAVWLVWELPVSVVITVLYDLYENCLCELSLRCLMTRMRTACELSLLVWQLFLWSVIRVLYDSYENCLSELSLRCFMTRMRTISVKCH